MLITPLQFVGTNRITNQDVLRIPHHDTYHAVWGNVAVPFALIGDIITFPVQVIVGGIVFATGNWTT